MIAIWLLTIFVGLLILALAIGRMFDMAPLQNRRWPGPHKSGSEPQRRSVVGLVPIGLGFALLGLGLAIGRPGGVITAIVLVAAAINFAAAALTFAGVMRLPTWNERPARITPTL